MCESRAIRRLSIRPGIPGVPNSRIGPLFRPAICSGQWSQTTSHRGKPRPRHAAKDRSINYFRSGRGYESRISGLVASSTTKRDNNCPNDPNGFSIFECLTNFRFPSDCTRDIVCDFSEADAHHRRNQARETIARSGGFRSTRSSGACSLR